MDVADFSYERPPIETLKAAGYGGVIRYLSNETGKNLTADELAGYQRAGIAVGLVWETTADRANGGYTAGHADGIEANRQADALGWPQDRTIAYAVDFSPSSTQLASVRDYFAGVRAAGGRCVGAYGSYAVLEDLVANQPVDCYWQCAAWSGKGQGSGGAIYVPDYGYDVRLSAHACLFQFYGSVKVPGTDHNVTLEAATGRASDLLWDITAPPEDSEEEAMAKVIYCPDQTGGVGWLPMLINGKRWRQGYASLEDLAADDGIITGSVTKHGLDGQHFLDRYPDITTKPYEGPRLFTCAPDTTWAREVAGLGLGETARFLLVPNAFVIRVRSDSQYGTDRFLGIPDVGTVDANILYNQPLLPWALGTGVDTAAIVAAVTGALSDISATIDSSTIDTIARRVVQALGASLSNG